MSYLRFVCCVFLFSLSSSCVPYVASFSALYIVDCPYGILYRLFNTDNTYVSDNLKSPLRSIIMLPLNS